MEQDDKSIIPDDFFYLSKVFDAHNNDIRCVVNTSESNFLSGSRDGTLKLWIERRGAFEKTVEIKQQERLHVNAVGFYSSAENWLIFAGLKNGTVEVFTRGSFAPVAVLRAHTENVCAIFVDEERKLLLTGSWDHRAIVWSIDSILNGQPPDFVKHGRDFAHHKHSVWAVATVPGPRLFFLTASADRTIKIFDHEYKELRVFTGHTDVVRTLTIISLTLFVSAANDGTLRVWNLFTGECVQKCEASVNEFIYTVSRLDHKNGKSYIIAGMERGFVEVWRVDESRLVPVQHFRVPVPNIWSSTTLRGTDVVFGTGSPRIYVFTTDESRKASPEILETFDAEISVLLTAEQIREKDDEITTIKVTVDDRPGGLNLKYRRGEDPALAADRFLQENGLPLSYHNEIVDYINAHVPKHLRFASPTKNSSNGKQLLLWDICAIPSELSDEKKFDYSFDVRLSNDGPAMRLGYNIGEDPDYAAQRFVDVNNLPQKFVPQLSNYLATQVPELAFGAKGSDGSFMRIGGGGGSSGTSAQSSSYVDPFTGGSRYVPGASDCAPSNGGDPFTSAGRYVPPSASSAAAIDRKRPRGPYVPLRNFFQFGVELASSKIIPKLEESNKKQSPEYQLNEAEFAAMQEIVITKDLAANGVHISALEKAFFNWPANEILPALDIFRVALLTVDLNLHFCADNGVKTLDRLISLLICDPTDPIRILVCRSLANAAVHEAGRKMLVSDISNTCSVVMKQFASPKPTVQIAAASAIANLARLLFTMESEGGGVSELGPREDVLRAIIAETESMSSFSTITQDGVLRILQAIATLMWGDATIIRLAKTRNVLAIVNRMKDAMADENVKAFCRDIAEMLYDV